MSVTVDFILRHGSTELTSLQAMERIIDLDEAYTRPWDLEGTLIINADDLEIHLQDTLVPLLSAVCLEAPISLAKTGHATATRTTEYGYLRMDAEGGWIRLGGDYLQSGRVEREPFLHALFAAATRLIDLLVALDLDGFEVRALREDRSLAIRAVGTADWSTEGSPTLPPIGPAAPREEAEGPISVHAEGPLSWSNGTQTLRLPGERAPWLRLLQSIVLPALEAHRSTVIQLPDAYGYVRFDAEGDRVRISGDGLADIRFPLEDVLSSLRGMHNQDQK